MLAGSCVEEKESKQENVRKGRRNTHTLASAGLLPTTNKHTMLDRW